MAHIDLYDAFNLNRKASPNDLWRALTRQLDSANATDTTLRSQLETARAILSDPARKATYDAQLADSAAPPLDPAALQALAATPGGAAAAAPAALSTSAAAASGLASIPVLATIALALTVAVAAALGWVVTRDDSDGERSAMPASTSLGPEDTSSGSAHPSAGSPAPESAQPDPPVPGAYPGAGGSRPVSATPLPTYVSRYGRLTSAHLLTPTGGIGCDFQSPGPEGKQGQCGVRSMNTVNSPLGTEKIGGSTKGKWLFPFAHNHVGAPYGSSGTTGWMNQPANDGYQVPRVEYGKQYYFENWAIASQENGLTVWNTTTGAGVFLSNEKAETFTGTGNQAPTAGSDDQTTVLGSMPSNGRGYGTAKPAEVYAGGSPTSRIRDITWSDWGADRAEGVGIGTWREGGRVGREQYIPATVVASDIGTCDGKRAYLKINWYFPSKGETLDSREGMRTCWTR